MSVPKARVVRNLVVAAFVVSCLASGVTSAFAQRGGGRGGFHGGFHGCFNCGAVRFRGRFGVGFGPAWGWGWPGWGWGWPGWGWGWGWPAWGWGWPGWSWGWPAWTSSGWVSPGWGWSAPPAYAGGGFPYAGGSPYAGGPSSRPVGQSCYAGAYICPIDRVVPSGSACYCTSNNRTHVPGRAN
jgi:hypothetical protein